MTTEFITPVGRLVQGKVLEGSTHDRKGQPHIIKTGTNKGQTTTRFFMALAVPKTPGVAAWWFEQDPFWMQIYNEGRAGFPQLFNAQGVCTHPRFAWKVMDGDGVDNDGVQNNTKQGMAGCWIIKFGGSYAPKLAHNDQLIIDPKYVKAGDYIQIAGNAAPNTGSDVPGLYMNPIGVRLIGYGEAITGGVDVISLFKSAPAVTLPPGASATPIASGPMPQLAPPQAGFTPPQQQFSPPPQAGFAPPQVQQLQPPPMQQLAPPPAVQQFAQSGIQPNHAFVQNAIGGAPQVQQLQPPPMQQLAPPPAVQQQPAYAMGPNAQGFTKEQWNAQGYTDDVLLAQGVIVRV